MGHLVELKITRTDWDEHIPGWNVAPLRLPVEVVHLRAGGVLVNPEHYESDYGLGRIRWRVTTPPPRQVWVQVKSTVTRINDHAALSGVWKKLAIILPVLATLATAAAAYWFPLGKAEPPDAWSRLAGDQAYDSFTHGGAVPELAGLWNVQLFEVDDQGNMTPYSVPDSNGEMIVYPPEKVKCTTEGALVSFSTVFSTGEGEELWAQGRISRFNDITLMSWPRSGTKGEGLVSVNLLRMKYELSHPIVLEGWRVGISRDLKKLRRSWIRYTQLAPP